MAWFLSIENIPCWKQILLFWESLAGTKSLNLGPSVANIKLKSITPSSQPWILYSGLPSLHKSIFPMIKCQDVPSQSQKGCHKSDILFSALPEGHRSKSTNTTEALSTFPMHTRCHLLLFADIPQSFAYLTTFVPFRMIWTSTA